MASHPGGIIPAATVDAREYERLQNAYADLKRKYDALVALGGQPTITLEQAAENFRNGPLGQGL